jgi:hypothetical protein
MKKSDKIGELQYTHENLNSKFLGLWPTQDKIY